MTFINFQDNNTSSLKTSNLSQYIIPEFYEVIKVNGTLTYTWYGVKECETIYSNQTSKTLANELKKINQEGNPWLCPNFSDDPNAAIVLENDPKVFP